jgi:plastocyanin
MGLKQGEEWSFVFDESGEWFYHDHLRSDMFGKIMVQE